MENLLELAAQELERRRALPPEVIRHLESAYGVSRDEVGDFLERELAGVEDYELDLILSPVFTPGLKDQCVFAERLAARSMAPEEIVGLIQGLVARPTIARIMTEDGVVHPVVMRDVSVARFIERLRLDGSMTDDVHQLILGGVPEDDRPLAFAMARRAVWELPLRQELLLRYLRRATAAREFQPADFAALLRLVEAYGPDGVEEFLARVPGWIDAVRREANAAGRPKPFFNERVEELHGGGRDQRPQADDKAAARAAELESLQRLRRILSD